MVDGLLAVAAAALFAAGLLGAAALRAVRARRRVSGELERLEACIEASGWAHYRVAPDGRIRWSRNAAEALAAGEEPLPGSLDGWLLRVDLPHRDEMRSRYRELRAGRPAGAREFTLRHGGAEVACEDIAAPFRAGPAAWEVVGLVRNVMVAKAMGEELKQARPVASVGRIAATIAHDLANVLTAIHGHSRLLAAAPASGEKAGQLTAAIAAAAERGRQLCHQILFVARPRAPRGEVDAGDLVEELRTMLAGLARPGIEVRTEAGPGELALQCNASRLLQALLNLCINALESMKDGGVLAIRCFAARNEAPRPGALGVVHVGSFVCFEISDSGEGIAPHLLDRIFEPGYSTKQGDAPRGLGLAIIASALAEIGAFLDVESRPSARGDAASGTTFRIFVPAPEASAAAAAAPPHGAGLGRGEPILIVDLEEESLVRMEDMVAGIGYEPNAFSSCEEALRSARERRAYQAALVATDVTLADGTPFYEAVARHIPSFRIVLVSRSGQGLPAAMPGLVEPFTRAELGAVLAKVVER
jgi:signal transduction histidine kinase